MNPPLESYIELKLSGSGAPIELRHNPSNTGPVIMLSGVPGPPGPPGSPEWQRTDW